MTSAILAPARRRPRAPALAPWDLGGEQPSLPTTTADVRRIGDQVRIIACVSQITASTG